MINFSNWNFLEHNETYSEFFLIGKNKNGEKQWQPFRVTSLTSPECVINIKDINLLHLEALIDDLYRLRVNLFCTISQKKLYYRVNGDEKEFEFDTWEIATTVEGLKKALEKEKAV